MGRIIVCEDATIRVQDERERGRREKLDDLAQRAAGLLRVGLESDARLP